ncbi:MAG: hypothetical protein ACW98X_14625, partial [Promethearchaeota archaeon]
IKNEDNPEYKEFDLINNFLQLLKDLDFGLKYVFTPPFNSMKGAYDELLKIIFKDELLDYQYYIDSNKKKELIQRFNLLIDLTDYTIDREGEAEVDIIDKKLERVMNNLTPLLKKVKLI